VEAVSAQEREAATVAEGLEVVERVEEASAEALVEVEEVGVMAEVVAERVAGGAEEPEEARVRAATEAVEWVAA